MAPTLVKGDVIQIKSAVFYKPKVGSIIVFLHPNHDHTTIHRIVSIVEKGNNIFYRTKGDANSKKDYYLVPANEVIGVMV
jgi:signal peptidase I